MQSRCCRRALDVRGELRGELTLGFSYIQVLAEVLCNLSWVVVRSASRFLIYNCLIIKGALLYWKDVWLKDQMVSHGQIFIDYRLIQMYIDTCIYARNCGLETC